MNNNDHYLKKELDNLVKSDSDIFSFLEASSLDGIWYWNLEKPEDEYMSPNFWKLFGYDPDEKEHLASEWQDMINPDDLKTATDNFNKHIQDPTHPYDQVVRYRHKDGSTIWVRCRGMAVRDKDGTPTRMLGAHNDYTAVKKAEEQERAKHKQLSSVLDVSLDGIMAFESVYDEDGEIVDFVWTLSNKKACEIVGTSEENLLGKKLSEFMPGNFEPLKSLNNKSLFEYYKNVVKTGKPTNLEFYYEQNGIKEWFENKAVKHEDGFVVTFNSITDIKNTKLELEKSEFQWRTAIESNGDGLWDWNLETNEIYFSPQYKSMIGYKDEELLNSLETFKDLCHPKHVDHVFGELTKYLEGKIYSFDVKFQFRCKDGSYKWIQGKGTIAKRDEDGKPLRVLGTHRDITKEYEKDLELKKVTQQLTQAQHTAKLGSWTYDLVEDKLEWSDEIFKIFGLDKKTFKPSYEAFISVIHPDDKEMVNQAFKDSVENKKPYTVEHKIITHDKIEKFVREKGHTYYDEFDKPAKTIGTVQDITEEKKKEKQLQKRLNEQEALLNIETAGFVRTLNRKFIWTNHAFENILGYNKGELLDQPTRIIYPDDDSYIKFGKGYLQLKEKGVYTSETRCIKKDGTPITLLGSMTPIDFETKEAIGVFTDITKLREQEEELIKAKEKAEGANQAKSTFLANMSHEIRTPLNGIIGLTDLALQTDLDETQKEYLSKSKISSKALLHVINDILDYSKIEAGKLEIVENEFNFEELLTHVNDLFGFKAYEKDLALNFYIDHTIPAKLLGDSLRLTQILNNLVGNALKFTHKGHVSIRVDKTSIDKNNKKVGLKISVEDSGIGISKEKQQKLFKAFEQGDNSMTKEFGGTGLGLIITKQLASLMGGEVYMKSSEGEGSTFSIELTLGYTQENKKFDKVEEIAKKRFLVVDDCELDRLYIKNVLSSWNIDTLTASDGVEALKVLENESVDYALVDWYMPNMDGLELLKTLQNSGMSLEHVFMITAHDVKELLEKAKAENVEIEKILHKPYTPSSLYNLLVDNKKVFEHTDEQESANIFLTETKTALVAEDNEINHIVIKQILEGIGFEVEIANDGKEALEMASKKSYDIVLMDLQMPVMDGFESTKKIREFDTTTPIYALSAAVMKEDKELTKEVGMDGHLAKPIDKKELYGVLQKHFEFTDTKDQNTQDIKTTNSIDINGIDMDELKARVNSDEELVKKMLHQFYISHKDTPQKLKDADVDSKEFDNMMHALKGVTGNMSMTELYKLSKEIYQSKDREFKEFKLPELIKKLKLMLDQISPTEQDKQDSAKPNIPKDQALDILEKSMKLVSSSSYMDEKQKEELYSAVYSLSDSDFASEIKESLDMFNYSVIKELLEKLLRDSEDG
jgi:PAS domain S-box-containing protein